MQETTVVLGLHDEAMQEGLLRQLEPVAGLRVVAAASEPHAVGSAVARLSPDAVVASPESLGNGASFGRAALLVVDERETTAALRAALAAGARGFYLWPEERQALVADLARLGGSRRTGPTARVVSVFAPRGGAGGTFLATHLAAACAERSRVVLADLDLHFAGVTTALGLPGNGDARTILDLSGTSEDLGAVLRAHPRGFRVLQAPSHPPMEGGLGPDGVRGLIPSLREQGDLVLLHLPRSLDPATVAAMEASDLVLLVVTLDVLAFRDAARTMEALAARDLTDRCRLVINRARRGDVVPEDAERVFGLRPVVTIPADAAVPRAQDRGQVLVGGRSRAARRVSELARSLLEDGT